MVTQDPHEMIEHLRARAGVLMTSLGPLIGRSVSWGQQILDGTICPDLPSADALARKLGAREPERLRLVEAVSRVKLERVGITGTDLDRVIEVLISIYRQRGTRT